MDYSHLFNKNEIKPVPSITKYAQELIGDLKKMKLYEAERLIDSEVKRMDEFNEFHKNYLNFAYINFKKILEEKVYENPKLSLSESVYDYDWWIDLKDFLSIEDSWSEIELNTFYGLNNTHAESHKYFLRHRKCIEIQGFILCNPDSFFERVDVNGLINIFSGEYSKNAQYSEKAIRTYLSRWYKYSGFNLQRAKAKNDAKEECKELKAINDGTLKHWEEKWSDFCKARTENSPN